MNSSVTSGTEADDILRAVNIPLTFIPETNGIAIRAGDKVVSFHIGRSFFSQECLVARVDRTEEPGRDQRALGYPGFLIHHLAPTHQREFRFRLAIVLGYHSFGDLLFLNLALEQW